MASQRYALPGEDMPLLMTADSKLKRASNSTVLKAMIEIMGRTAALARTREQPELAQRLSEATAHGTGYATRASAT